MYSFKVLAIASFLSSALAIPLITRDDSSSSVAYFTTLAGHSSSPINKKPVNANGYSFWIGKPTSSNCPDGVAPTSCPKGKKTVIEVNAMNGTCIMVGHRISILNIAFRTDDRLYRTSKYLAVKPSTLQRTDLSNILCPIQEVRYRQMAPQTASS